MRAEAWVRNRLRSYTVHLDVAACGRMSIATLDAMTAHLQAEASGGYVAEARNREIPRGRAALAGFVNLGPDHVAFGESGAAAFARLLAAWPLAAGARVGIVASEFGGNAKVLQQLAAVRGWELVSMPVDGLGRIVDVPRGLDLVTFPQVPSQRGIAQPVEDVLAAGVPVVLDVAQALGQTPVPRGCAAYVGTSRKWLCGPRGVGFAIVEPSWLRALAPPPILARDGDDSPAAPFESPEANIAGRVGLAVAAQEWTEELLASVHSLASQLRRRLCGLSGWSVVEPADEPTGITTLVGGDPHQVRAALLAQGFVTSAVPTSRAADMEQPALRISTGPWVTEDDLDTFAAALRATI